MGYQHLDEIYRKRARYCVIFISESYAKKLWTTHELRSAQARAFEDHREYILPVRLDRTEVAGILPTVGYIDGARTSPGEVADLIVAKLRGVSEQCATPASATIAPAEAPKPPAILHEHSKVVAVRERLPEPFEACQRYHDRVGDLVRSGNGRITLVRLTHRNCCVPTRRCLTHCERFRATFGQLPNRSSATVRRRYSDLAVQ